MQNPGMILTAVMATFVATAWTTGYSPDWPPDPRQTVNLAGTHTFKVKVTLPLEEIARAKDEDSPGPWAAEWQTDWEEESFRLFHVPKDRWLVVTDYYGPSLHERWGKVMRLKSVEFPGAALQSFRAGLVFAPGTEVVVRVTQLQHDRRAVIEPGVEHQNLHAEWEEGFGYMLLGYLVTR